MTSGRAEEMTARINEDLPSLEGEVFVRRDGSICTIDGDVGLSLRDLKAIVQILENGKMEDLEEQVRDLATQVSDLLSWKISREGEE